MAFKLNLSPIIFALLLASPVFGQTVPPKYYSIEYFKNYALSTCLADGFHNEKEVVADASAAARGYLEFGSLPLEAHTEATKLGREFLAKEYKSMTGEKLTMMKCIDFYHSKELDLIARKYLKTREQRLRQFAHGKRKQGQ